MKKFLSLFSVIAIGSVSTSTLVGCGDIDAYGKITNELVKNNVLEKGNKDVFAAGSKLKNIAIHYTYNGDAAAAKTAFVNAFNVEINKIIKTADEGYKYIYSDKFDTMAINPKDANGKVIDATHVDNSSVFKTMQNWDGLVPNFTTNQTSSTVANSYLIYKVYNSSNLKKQVIIKVVDFQFQIVPTKVN